MASANKSTSINREKIHRKDDDQNGKLENLTGILQGYPLNADFSSQLELNMVNHRS